MRRMIHERTPNKDFSIPVEHAEKAMQEESDLQKIPRVDSLGIEYGTCEVGLTALQVRHLGARFSALHVD
jgi:hypothetical protein